MKVGVVTVAHGRHEHLALQRRSLDASTVLPGVHVLVAMDDAVLESWSPGGPVPTAVVPMPGAGPLPLARARNAGVERALQEGAEVVVGLDVDCLASPTLVEGYARAAAGPHGDALLCGPVAYLPPPPPGGYDLDAVEHLALPHPARPAPEPGEVARAGDDHHLFWSLSYAVTAATWRRLGGFDERYVGYGAEDTDLGRRAASLGIDLAWVGSARASHQHHPVSSPPVEHVDDIVRNAGLYHRTWGEWPMQGWLDAFEERGLVERLPDGRYVRLDART